MKTTLKFYKYYLKRLLKSWYFWFFSILGLAVVFGLPFFIYSLDKSSTTNFKQEYPTYKDFVKIGLEGDEYSRRKSSMIWGGSEPLEFMKFNENVKLEEALKVNWKIFKNNQIILFGSFALVLFPIYHLINQSQINGEDKTVLTTASPITRNDLVISKLLALFSYFWIGIYFTATIPYIFYYCWIGNIVAKFLILFIFTNLIFYPILHFLLFSALHILLGSLLGSYLFQFSFLFFTLWFPPLIKLGLFYLISEKSATEINKYSENIFIITPIALAMGIGLLYLYWKRFNERDFN